jgi:hypothetical protein
MRSDIIHPISKMQQPAQHPRASGDDISQPLSVWSQGGQQALDKLTPIACDELHRLAGTGTGDGL